MRRLKTPMEQATKIPKPRMLHNTQWGKTCAVETPEGSQCGLVKNLALMSIISIGSRSTPLWLYLKELGVQKDFNHTTPKVFVNGAWVGTHSDPATLALSMRSLRRCQDISSEVSIVNLEREVWITTDSGRFLRPLFIVENHQLLCTPEHFAQIKNRHQTNLTWNDLLSMGIVEYIDTDLSLIHI